MTKEELLRLESLNQLDLDEVQTDEVIAFFEAQGAEFDKLSSVDTENVERMVHVMPILTVVRDDVMIKMFTRDELQKEAPETMDGYWQVPRLVD